MQHLPRVYHKTHQSVQDNAAKDLVKAPAPQTPSVVRHTMGQALGYRCYQAG